MIVDGIDLAAAGVVKRGTFDENGLPTGWWIKSTAHIVGTKNIFTSEKIEKEWNDPVMYVDNTDPNFKIFIRGQFSPTLTEESNKAKKSAS